MTPYFKDGKEWDRVTEVIAVGECQATAHIRKNPTMKNNPRTSHIVTLPGTILHAKIQQQLDAQLGKPPKGLFLEGPAKKLFGKLYLQHNKQQKQNPNTQTTYNDIMNTVNDCFANYLAFAVDHPFTPLLVEHQMFSKTYDVGGTVDLVGLFWVKGHVIKATPDKKHLPKKRYFKVCDHSSRCSCTKAEVVCVVDWKSSIRKQDGHRIQLSAYFCMLEESGVFDKLRHKGHHICWDTWSVLLGVHSYKKYQTVYQLHLYDSDVTDFLVRREVSLSPRYISLNLKGKTGLKGRCMFCSLLLSCPDRLLWDIDENILFNTPFTRTELANMALIMGNKKSDHFKGLSTKINTYLEMARLEEREIEAVVPTILGEIERELDIITAKKTVS